MERHSLTGIFASLDDAGRAREALLHAGVPRERITVSFPETADGIAGEAPGESYENQAGEDRHSVERGRFGTAARSGVCTVSVDADSDRDCERLAQVLRAGGAREVTRPPA